MCGERRGEAAGRERVASAGMQVEPLDTVEWDEVDEIWAMAQQEMDAEGKIGVEAGSGGLGLVGGAGNTRPCVSI